MRFGLHAHNIPAVIIMTTLMMTKSSLGTTVKRQRAKMKEPCPTGFLQHIFQVFELSKQEKVVGEVLGQVLSLRSTALLLRLHFV